MEIIETWFHRLFRVIYKVFDWLILLSAIFIALIGFYELLLTDDGHEIAAPLLFWALVVAIFGLFIYPRIARNVVKIFYYIKYGESSVTFSKNETRK